VKNNFGNNGKSNNKEYRALPPKFTPKKGENDRQSIWLGKVDGFDDSDEEWINN